MNGGSDAKRGLNIWLKKTRKEDGDWKSENDPVRFVLHFARAAVAHNTLTCYPFFIASSTSEVVQLSRWELEIVCRSRHLEEEDGVHLGRSRVPLTHLWLRSSRQGVVLQSVVLLSLVFRVVCVLARFCVRYTTLEHLER